MAFSCSFLVSSKETASEAEDIKDWTEWPKVMFPDEGKFCMSFEKSRSQSLEDEGRGTVSTLLSVEFPQSVMVWGAASSAAVSPPCFLRSTVNAAVYQHLLDHFTLPAADQLYRDADFIS